VTRTSNHNVLKAAREKQEQSVEASRINVKHKPGLVLSLHKVLTLLCVKLLEIIPSDQMLLVLMHNEWQFRSSVESIYE